MINNEANDAPDQSEEVSKDIKQAPEVETVLSKVASNPKGSMAIMAVVVIAFGYWMYGVITDDSDKPKKEVVQVPKNVVKPTQDSSESQQSGAKAPPVPTLPKLVAPTPPPPPKPDVVKPDEVPLPEANAAKPTLNLPNNSIGGFDYKLKEREEAKRKSSIILLAGNATKTQEEVAQDVDFKMRGDLSLILGKGKVIDAVLETALSTDFGGDVRAVVSRDVYSEGSKHVLIPKGSRIFGTYQAAIEGAYGRINVAWERVDLPSGYSVNLIGNAVDNLGRVGVDGRVDNKYTERFSNAVLTSAFSIALAGALDKIVKPPQPVVTASANATLATSINSAVMSIATGSSYTNSQQKINAICIQIPQLISDKGSSMYMSIMSSCAQYQNSVAGNPDQNLQALITSLNAAANNTSQSAAVASTPSQQQEASKKAFTDISDTVKDMIKQNDFKPTITVNQGEHIRIYVNKDYVFPGKIVNQVRILQ
jgi:type IV secretion system protein VirB10